MTLDTVNTNLDRVRFIADALRGQEQNATTTRAELYKEVRAAHQAGASGYDIAQAWGVRPSFVYYILRKEENK